MHWYFDVSGKNRKKKTFNIKVSVYELYLQTWGFACFELKEKQGYIVQFL